ncbi:unnamed protein product [Withania somnifera]
MYIGSPSNEEDDEMNCEGDFVVDDDVGRNNNDDDTDDSMASDASSGPSHHIVRNANKSPIPKLKGNGKSCSNDKPSIKKGTKGAKVPSKSNGEKVKKSIWKGKGK